MRLLIALFSLFLFAPGMAEARELTVDLTDPVVRITTGFSGTDLLLYGAINEPGDVVVVVRGPAKDRVVRRKEKIAGVWVNRAAYQFREVPSFYWTASNRPIDEFFPKNLKAIHQIGLEHLDLKPLDSPELSLDSAQFRAGLIRNMQNNDLYMIEPEDVVFLSQNLFRTRITFPANVSVGTFGVDVFLIRDGELAGFETTLLTVRKFGIEAGIYDLAHDQSLLYGLMAVLIAVFSGWVANAAFRKS